MSDERLDDVALARIAAADQARTPGEWKLLLFAYAVYAPGITTPVARDVAQADGTFIAVASWAVPALLAEVARLRAENAEMYKSLMDYSGLEDDK